MDEFDETSTDETAEFAEYSFGKEIAKTFVVSTAAAAGTLAGIMVIGLAVEKLSNFRDRRKAKKNAAKTDTVKD